MGWLQSKEIRQLLVVLVGGLIIGMGYGLLQLIEPVTIAPLVNTNPQFAGQALLVASDADMVATAYADGRLERVPGIKDTLTVVDLPLDPANPVVSEVLVSNSVMSWPQIIALSPDRQRVYVAEVRSQPADGIQAFDTIDQMPDGKHITVVDISDPTSPSVLESLPVGRNPEHLSISPDGQFLAVNLEDPGRELLIIQLQDDGRLGPRSYFPMSIDGTRQDNRAAIWHPSGRYLAMTQDHNRRVGFYEVQKTGTEIAIRPMGEPLTVGNHLSNPRFTSDGHFLLVPDLKWSMYGNPTLSALLNPKGDIVSIRFEPGTLPEIVSRAEVGLSPEGFALSPDDSLIATVNMRRTYLPHFIPAWRGKPFSSLSLVTLDPVSGQLTTVGEEYGFEGLLPEQATFDVTGHSLAVVIYNYREPMPRTGAIEFWHVVAGESPHLERTGYKLDVVRGAHDIVLAL